MEANRRIVETVDTNGKPIKLAVVKPSNRITQDSNMAYNLKMARLIRQGANNSDDRLLLRAELEEYLAKTGIWTAQDILKVEKLANELRACELMLKKGGLKISEGRSLAIKMAELRQTIMALYAKRQQFDSATIESQAENYRFEFMMVNCVVYADSGKKFFQNYDEYVDRQTEDAVVACAKELASIIYDLDNNVSMNMFEMQWLKEAGFIDDNGQYRNEKGHRVDRDGRLLNNEGRYIDENGKMIDHLGRPIDEKGNILVDSSKPFIDDKTGQPVVISGIGKQAMVKQKKTRTSKKGNKKTTKQVAT